TCAKTMPGALDHEDVDAQTFADWGVDYLKYDNCNNQGRPALELYTKMRDALKKTGRPIVYSLCEWGENKPWTWGADVGHLWRTTGDIKDNWAKMLQLLKANAPLAPYAGPGHWNDPDMLEVGNGGMTNEEYRSHFSLWAMLAAPLMAGNDLKTMTPEIREILTNKEVIAIDQDALGRQGRRVHKEGDREVFAKQLADGSRAVILLNRGKAPLEVTATWEDLGYPSHLAASVRDLWQHKDVGKFTGKYSAQVPSHGVV